MKDIGLMTLIHCRLDDIYGEDNAGAHCRLDDIYGEDIAGEDMEEDWGEIGEKKTQ